MIYFIPAMRISLQKGNIRHTYRQFTREYTTLHAEKWAKKQQQQKGK